MHYRNTTLKLLTVFAVVVLPGCSAGTSPKTVRNPVLYQVGAPIPKGGGRAIVGKPYYRYGRWFYPARDRYYDKTGTASWYGPGLHGRKTANGEVFNSRSLTAAHPTLPLPSYVEVTNLENGRRLVLRANDRGPFIDNRIIDLTERAADLLGYHQSGTARVRVRYLGPAPISGNDDYEERYAARQGYASYAQATRRQAHRVPYRRPVVRSNRKWPLRTR